MTSPLSSPEHPKSTIHRVAILFAGGPAPAANAVISDRRRFVHAQRHRSHRHLNGYSHLVEFTPEPSAREGVRDYIIIDPAADAPRRATRRAFLIGTARANPGKDVSQPRRIWTIRRR